MSKRAYERLSVEERRRRLLDIGASLFSAHAFDELSMADIARRAGISKALLYHYFPSKEKLYLATLEQQAHELRALTRTDPTQAPRRQLADSLDTFLSWVEGHADEYRALLRSAGSVPQIRDVIDDVRRDVVRRVLEGLDRTEDPRARVAAHGWLGFVDGAISDWLDHRDVDRQTLADLLLETLVTALHAGERSDG